MPQSFGWILVAVGLVIAAFGLLWLIGGASWLGRLPGDIVIKSGNSRFYFPIVTCIVLSVMLSVAMWIISLLRR